MKGLAIVGLLLALLTPLFWLGVALLAVAFGIWLGRRGAFEPAEPPPRRPAHVISLDARRQASRRRHWSTGGRFH